MKFHSNPDFNNFPPYKSYLLYIYFTNFQIKTVKNCWDCFRNSEDFCFVDENLSNQRSFTKLCRCLRIQWQGNKWLFWPLKIADICQSFCPPQLLMAYLYKMSAHLLILRLPCCPLRVGLKYQGFLSRIRAWFQYCFLYQKTIGNWAFCPVLNIVLG